MIIKQQYVSSRAVTFPNINQRKTITIHETGNTKKGAGAQAHANLQSKGFTSSWHWQVDDALAVQSYPHTVQCWHAGDGQGNGNLHSIAIEICVNEDSNYETAVRNAAKLTRKIMQEENISLQQVVQHNYWGLKDCPQLLRSGRQNVNWNGFKQLIQAADDPKSIQYGRVGNDVKQVQRDLNELGYKLSVDGSFGPLTRRAVQYFQAMYGLPIERHISPRTTVVIQQALQTKLPIQQLKYGDTGGAVGQLQLSLTAAGYPVSIDNSLGPLTLQAVQSLQKEERITVNGIVNLITWKVLKGRVFK